MTIADIKQANELVEAKSAQMDAQDAEAEADPYGALLVSNDPNRGPSLMFWKVCSLTENDDKRYREAHERLGE